MKLLIALLLINIATIANCATVNFNPIAQKSYRLETSKKINFIEAKNHCAKYGLSMVKIESKTEADWIFDKITEDPFWIAIKPTRKGTRPSKWIDESSIEYQPNWISSENSTI